MKQTTYLLLLLAIMLGGNVAFGQGSPGPTSKKARTPEDYKPRTLKELAARPADATNLNDPVIVQGNVLPSRVRVIYAGSTRPLPQPRKDLLHRWAQLYAGSPEHYTVPYQTELLFSEEGQQYWLAVRKQSVAEFEKELKKGEAIDLFLIRLGWSASAGQWEPLLLVEVFQPI